MLGVAGLERLAVVQRLENERVQRKKIRANPFFWLPIPYYWRTIPIEP